VAEAGRDFIRDIIAADLAANRHTSVVTRFRRSPKDTCTSGHAKAICLNFGVAQEFGGRCHLRFDDTNPTKEEQEYIDAIERRRFAGSASTGNPPLSRLGLFRATLRVAEHLIRTGKAYVDDQSQEEMRPTAGR